jgi:hypothetical protein
MTKNKKEEITSNQSRILGVRGRRGHLPFWVRKSFS